MSNYSLNFLTKMQKCALNSVNSMKQRQLQIIKQVPTFAIKMQTQFIAQFRSSLPEGGEKKKANGLN